MKGKVKQRITADFVIDLYQESKKKKGKEAEHLLNVAKQLSAHLNEILVVPEDIIKKP